MYDDEFEIVVSKSELLYAAVPHQLEAATVFEMSRPLAEPTLRPTMSAKDEMTPARSRAPREVSASAASSRPGVGRVATAQHT